MHSVVAVAVGVVVIVSHILATTIVVRKVWSVLASAQARSIRSSDVQRQQTVAVLVDVELDGLTVVQASAGGMGRLDATLVNENVLVRVGACDEAESILEVVPLDQTGHSLVNQMAWRSTRGTLISIIITISTVASVLRSTVLVRAMRVGLLLLRSALQLLLLLWNIVEVSGWCLLLLLRNLIVVASRTVGERSLFTTTTILIAVVVVRTVVVVAVVIIILIVVIVIVVVVVSVVVFRSVAVSRHISAVHLTLTVVVASVDVLLVVLLRTDRSVALLKFIRTEASLLAPEAVVFIVVVSAVSGLLIVAVASSLPLSSSLSIIVTVV